jgi:iron complex outermembrane receptor protein
VNYSRGNRKVYLANYINLQGVQRDDAAGKKGGFAFIGNNELRTYQITNTLSYAKQVSSNLNLNAVIGHEYLKNDYSGDGLGGYNFDNTSVPYYNMLGFSTQGERIVFSFADPTTELQSFFARGIFNIMDRVVITGTFRADGSTRFGKNNQYGYFPSIAAAWNLHNESFKALSRD